MIWKTFVNRLAMRSRQRGLATAVVYGLSLAVRFTSATGEEMEIPTQSVPRTHPLVSIMTRGGAQPYRDWASNAARPMVLRHEWPPGSGSCPGM
jgi:hypothetical protein